MRSGLLASPPEASLTLSRGPIRSLFHSTGPSLPTPLPTALRDSSCQSNDPVGQQAAGPQLSSDELSGLGSRQQL